MIRTKKFFFSNIWIIVSCFGLLVSYFLFQPRVSNRIPFVREYKLSNFIRNTVKNDGIPVQEFWQLREFYSPGLIQFNKPNLIFTSNKIASHETLISNNIALKSILPKLTNWHILYKNTNELIAASGNETLIYFIKPILEMTQANAYFDNKDTDEPLLKNKNWYVVTHIQK